MTISKAISTRIINICREKNISINKLANISFLTQSTLQSIVSGDSGNPKLLTIYRVCYGLEISLEEFFSDEIFNDLDLKI